MKKLLSLLLLTLAVSFGACAQAPSPGIPDGTAAPNFTLPDAQGKEISLSDLKGKWVVLDFWGSWCRWCIKGFPQMKENYAKLGDEVAFVGVACRDSKENWLKALDQYKLPWINLWASDDNLKKISADYSLRGFPTKLIIAPAGKVRNTTIGEDPAFYDTLNSLISGK